jgi:hypothetical protein
MKGGLWLQLAVCVCPPNFCKDAYEISLLSVCVSSIFVRRRIIAKLSSDHFVACMSLSMTVSPNFFPF